MAFHEREFDTYAILGDPRLPELWVWPRWREVVDVLTPLVSAARGKAVVRTDHSLATHQCAENPSLLADCWMCVSFVGLDAGAPAVCELPCRLGHDADCPSGQHCLAPDQAPATGETSPGCALDYPNDAFGYCG